MYFIIIKKNKGGHENIFYNPGRFNRRKVGKPCSKLFNIYV